MGVVLAHCFGCGGSEGEVMRASWGVDGREGGLTRCVGYVLEVVGLGSWRSCGLVCVVEC